jgi:outer membrane scaffolding protein for murein synthesis (MipA/OmpV family)
MKRILLAAALCATLAATAVSAAAQDDPPAEWSFTLGAGAMYAPDYEGSDEYEVSPVPLIDVSWRDRVRLTTIDGIGLFASPLKMESLSLDLGVQYEFGRSDDDNDALKGLGDLDGGAVGVVRLGYEIGDIGLALEIARDISGDRNGLAATAEAEYGIDLFSGRGWFSVTPHLTWADGEYMDNSFGITKAQAERSARGYAPYDAEAGFKDAGIALGLAYRITDSIQVMGQIDYARLLGDAADSPLVGREGSADQVSGVLGVSYSW